MRYRARLLDYARCITNSARKHGQSTMATRAYSDSYASGLSDMTYAETSSKHSYKGREEGLWNCGYWRGVTHWVHDRCNVPRDADIQFDIVIL
jgi:hypothetical protein